MKSTDAQKLSALISDRCQAIDVSGIRKVFELGAQLENPINLSIGQPDFPVPDPIKQATIRAIEENRNGYTLTQGDGALLDAIHTRLAEDLGWQCPSSNLRAFVTSGTSGALLLAFMALLNPGDEVVIPDPYFVIYPAHAKLAGASVRFCDTYPDFRMTAERVEPLLTDRTKIVLVNSPGNPSGVVLSEDEVRELAALCGERGVVLITDEIYDEFTYSDSLHDCRCPSPARYTQQCLVIRGFGKTYGCTGWRLGYAAGPTHIIEQMMKLQQYTFVCAPSMAQAGIVAAFDTDMSEQIRLYQSRRDLVMEHLGDLASVQQPGGAFYAFVEVPPALGMTGTQFAERAIEHNLLIIPGGIFSERDTHFRLSFAAPTDRLEQGLATLRELLTS